MFDIQPIFSSFLVKKKLDLDTKAIKTWVERSLYKDYKLDLQFNEEVLKDFYFNIAQGYQISSDSDYTKDVNMKNNFSDVLGDLNYSNINENLDKISEFLNLDLPNAYLKKIFI